MAPKRKAGDSEQDSAKKTKQNEAGVVKASAPAKISFSVEHWYVT